MSIAHIPIHQQFKIFSGFKDIIAKQQNILVNSGSNNSYEKYLEFTLNKFDSYLKNAFDDHYIYSRAYYRDKSNNFKVHSITRSLDKYSQIFDEGIKKAENIVINSNDEKLRKSFYYMLVNRDLLGSVFHFGNLHLAIKYIEGDVERILYTEFNIPKLIYYSFENADCKSLFYELDKAKLINDSNKIEDIDQVYEIHKKTADKAKNEGLEQFYCYLLRGRNLEERFNTSLYLVLKRPLFVGEYQQIADYFTYIMQASIKLYYKPDVQQEEWERIFRNQSHVNQSEFHALKIAIEEMNSRRTSTDKIYKKEYMKAVKFLEELSLRNKLILDISRFSSMGYENASKESYFEKKIEISLGKHFNYCLNCLKGSLDLLPIDKKKKEFIAKKIIPQLLKDSKKWNRVYIPTSDTTLKIVLIERLKNAFSYCSDTAPSVQIDIKPDINQIIIKNSGLISDDDLYKINSRSITDTTLNQRNKIGERLCFQVVDYLNKVYDLGQWKIIGKKNEETQQTIFEISTPNISSR